MRTIGWRIINDHSDLVRGDLREGELSLNQIIVGDNPTGNIDKSSAIPVLHIEVGDAIERERSSVVHRGAGIEVILQRVYIYFRDALTTIEVNL